MYLDGYEKMVMIFDGRGSDQMNWFSPDRLITSPWTDLPGSTQFNSGTGYTWFSIDGGHGNRRFYIMHIAGGACSPTGWTLITTGECVWQKPIGNAARRFLYSTAKTSLYFIAANLSKLGDADVMAVFVKQE